MELRNEILIEAPAERVWHVLGERFLHVSEWAAPITSSCPVAGDALETGTTRSCTIAPFGPFDAGVVEERLTRFDHETMTFEYVALRGLPRFVTHAVNRWSVSRIDDRRSRVSIHATLTLAQPMALLGCVLKWQLESGGAKVAEELKHFVETGRAHPRKLAAVAKRQPERH